MADWSQLPTELLHLISNRLNSDLYLLRFRSVCSTWRSSTPFPNPNHHHQNLPSKLPLLSNSINDSNTINKSTIFTLSKRTLFLILPPPKNPPLNHRHYEPHEPWIIKINNSNNQLLNPLSHYLRLPRYFPPVLDFSDLSVVELGHEFVLGDDADFSSLPPTLSFNNLFLEKVVLFEIERRFFLFTIQASGKLAVFRIGDDRWTIIPEMPTAYDDVCVFKGKPIAVDRNGRTVRVRVGVGVGIEPELGLDLVAGPVFGGDKKYLVESNGELLLLDKHMSRAFDDDDDDEDDDNDDDDFHDDDADDDDDNNDDDDDDDDDDDGDDDDDYNGGIVAGHNYGVEWIVRFDIYKLDEKEKRWVELRNLGDRCLFLGDDCSFSLSASDLGSSIYGNCVIFRDDAFLRFEFEMAVFDLDIRKTTPLQKDYHGHYELFMPPNWASLR